MASEPPSNNAVIMSTGRLEAFSDGVFAVAITLLILNIQSPSAQQISDSNHSLAGALGANWPAYLSYVLSFITVGITWINHHQMFKFITRTDHTLLFLNLLLLMCITFIPFPTALLAQYINQQPDQQRTASLVYGGLFTVMSIMFNGVWWYAVWRKLTDPSQHMTSYRNMALRYIPGPVLYLIATLFSFVSAWISVAMYFGLAIFYAFSNMSFSRLGDVKPKQSELLSE
jgi:uncharacterized membrane protein